MERGRPEQRITIHVPLAKVEWHKKGKEIAVDGNMFDIKSFSISGGVLTATGYYDDVETELIHLLSNLITGKLATVLQQLFWFLQCLTVLLHFFLLLPVYRQSRVLSAFFPLFIPQPVCLMEDRPPRCCLSIAATSTSH